MCLVSFPTGRHRGITWPLNCRSEQSEASQRSDFQSAGQCQEGFQEAQDIITGLCSSDCSAARSARTRRTSPGSR